MKNVKEIINMSYRGITKKGLFDIEKGNLPIPKVLNKEMSEIPDEMTDYVNEKGYGCCFVFSAYMLKILRKYNINAYMITSIEENGLRASVLYEDNGEMYIANPVEDIEFFTENKIKPDDRYKYYIGDTCIMDVDGEKHDDSRYTVSQFTEKYGQLWLLGKMDSSETKTLAETMDERLNKCIAPPEKSNLDIKRLIKK